MPTTVALKRETLTDSPLADWLIYTDNWRVLQLFAALGLVAVDDMFVLGACCAGSLQTAKWAIAHMGAPINKWALGGAAASGNLELVRYLHQRSAPTFGTELLHAAENGNGEIALWLHRHGYRDSDSGAGALAKAAGVGDLKLVQQLIAEGCPVGPLAMSEAAGAGRFAVVQALHARHRKAVMRPEAFHGPVCSGNLLMLEWLVRAGYPLGPASVPRYWWRTRVSTLELLVRMGCQIDAAAVASSALVSGSVDVLQWLDNAAAVDWRSVQAENSRRMQLRLKRARAEVQPAVDWLAQRCAE